MAEWVCSHCEQELEGDQPSVPCPACGAVGRKTHMVIEDTVEVFTSIGIRKKVPGLPKKKRIRIEHFQGWEARRSEGDLVKKERRIDKDADTYFEHVEDREGNAIHHCEEPLTEHRGHGSARQQEQSDEE
jgi:hypothetical protein